MVATMSKFEKWNKQFIGGTWREGSSENFYMNQNPFNEESLVEIKLATIDDVNEAYECAKAAQKEWAKVNAYAKSAIMEKAVQLLAERREELADFLVEETGSSYLKANTEIELTLALMKEASAFPLQMHGTITPSLIPGKENRMYRTPVGVVGVISPFNFPLYLTMRSVAPALATGNAVVIKPDLKTMITGGLFLAKLFDDAGIPKGLINVTVADMAEIGDSFVDHPIPKVISFTGSTGAGRRIAEICGRNLKRVALELGGNNAMIVLKDADIEKAAKAAAFGKFLHAGQICMAINRIIVEREIHDEFVSKFKEIVANIHVGDPRNEANMVGPLIDRRQVDRILNLVEESVQKGAEVIMEGKVNGNVMAPFILTNVKNDSPIASQEIFGPVAAIIAVDNEEEAIRIANDSDYGLSGAVHAGSIERGVEIAKQLETGMIHVNDQSVNAEPIVAFGGEKSSGLGRTGGEWSIEEFTTIKWISIQTETRQYPFN
jgi:acyl-CoA reductase-like NAD-dependent aldehyde dehydrogenase